MRFVDPKNDVAFKKIFGDEHRTSILISFLNAVLDLHGDREIEHIEILNPFQAPRIEILKYTSLDVRARDRRGITFIVEMQVEGLPGYRKRFLYYAAKAYVSQMPRGGDYPRLNQVIFIGILNFHAFEGDAYLTRHLILNTSTQKQDIADLEFNFIELPKFTKQEADLEDVLDKWIYFLKHAERLDVMPSHVDEPPLHEAYDIANQFSWSREEMEVYDYWDMRAQDEAGKIEAAVEEAETRGLKRGMERGHQEGRQEGMVDGEHNKALDTARKMLARGYATADIADLTGLPLEEIGTLVESLSP